MPSMDQSGHHLMPMHSYPQATYLCTSCGTRRMTAEVPPSVCPRGCGISVCPGCAAAPGCPNGHALQFAHTTQNWRCDMCQQVSQAGQPAHSCRGCNYDQCRSCTLGPQDAFAADSPVGGRIHHHGGHHGGGGFSHATGIDYSKVQPVFSGAHGMPPSHIFQWMMGGGSAGGVPQNVTMGGGNGGYGAFQQQQQQQQQQQPHHHPQAALFAPAWATAQPASTAVSQQLVAAAATPAVGGEKRRRFRRHSNHQAPPAVAMEAPKGGRMRSLFIGINYFHTEAQLSGCINDVAVMMGVAQAMGFDISDRRVLVDDSSFPGVTGEPTRAEIMDSMKWLVADARKGDHFFIHYSGHGVQTADAKADKADNGTAETLAPVDYKTAGLLYDREIYELLCPRLPSGCRLTALFDCCHSGDVMNLEYFWQWDDAKRQDGEFVRRERADIPADILVFSGCKDEQTSADVSDTTSFQTKFTAAKNTPGSAGGACTNALAEVVAAKMGSDGKCHVSFEELLRMMQESLTRRKFDQVPQLSASCTINLDSEFSLFGALPEDPK